MFDKVWSVLDVAEWAGLAGVSQCSGQKPFGSHDEGSPPQELATWATKSGNRMWWTWLRWLGGYVVNVEGFGSCPQSTPLMLFHRPQFRHCCYANRSISPNWTLQYKQRMCIIYICCAFTLFCGQPSQEAIARPGKYCQRCLCPELWPRVGWVWWELFPWGWTATNNHVYTTILCITLLCCAFTLFCGQPSQEAIARPGKYCQRCLCPELWPKSSV